MHPHEQKIIALISAQDRIVIGQEMRKAIQARRAQENFQESKKQNKLHLHEIDALDQME